MKKEKTHIESVGKETRRHKGTKKRSLIVFPEYQYRNIHADNRILIWTGGRNEK